MSQSPASCYGSRSINSISKTRSAQKHPVRSQKRMLQIVSSLKSLREAKHRLRCTSVRFLSNLSLRSPWQLRSSTTGCTHWVTRTTCTSLPQPCCVSLLLATCRSRDVLPNETNTGESLHLYAFQYRTKMLDQTADSSLTSIYEKYTSQ